MQVEVNGTTLHVEEKGEGPALLFVHGMCGDAEAWAGQVERLADRYRCITYDRRGHSRSPRTPDVAETVQLHADDAAALIEALDAAPCLIVGSSGGARVTLDVVQRHSKLLAGAVMSEPPVPALAPDAFAAMVAELKPIIGAAVESGGPRAAVDAFFEMICPGLWSIAEDTVKDRYRGNADMLFADIGMPSYEITASDIARIDLPTVVVVGATSVPALMAGARNLAAQLPDVRLIELECGHVTYAEQPDAFARAISTFADELTRNRAAR